MYLTGMQDAILTIIVFFFFFLGLNRVTIGIVSAFLFVYTIAFHFV